VTEDATTVTIEVNGKPINLVVHIENIASRPEPLRWQATAILPPPARGLAAEGQGATRDEAIEDLKRLAENRLLAVTWLP
jgi:hypothetical protein